MTANALATISLLSLLATAFVNLGYRALREFSRNDLAEICTRHGRPERFGEILRGHEQVALGVEICGAFMAALALIAGAAWASVHWRFEPSQSPGALLGTAGAMGLALVIARTWAPWAGARVFAEEFLYRTWPLWRLMAAITSPLAWGARLLDMLLHRMAGRTPQVVDEQAIEEEIRTIVSEGHRGGLLEDEAREMIEGVIDLADAYVSQIMTPRTDMHMINADVPWDQLLSDVIESRHTRIPVYDKTRDDIVGILYIKDLLPELATAKPESHTPLRELLRKPLFVPETKAVDDLLQMFQQLRTHIAVVLDEYGGVSGLVTIEDVLEEIVGEIDDEYDPEPVEEMVRIDDDALEALGRTHIDEINEAMGLELPEDGDYDTIAGLVFSLLGRVPQSGESVAWRDEVRIIVLEATRRRIERVRIERLAGNKRESA
ncbi:MAG: HlyC/CorC family transporter [Planctomycetota bacterium]|nr:MAG: HlyC/CorC family transporter [Planctomycetota bacterium]